MEVSMNIGPGRGGCARKDDSKYFSRGFFGTEVSIALKKYLRKIHLSEREFELLKKTSDFFKSASRGLTQIEGEITAIEGRTPLQTEPGEPDAIETLGEVMDMLREIRKERAWSSDTKLEPIRRAAERTYSTSDLKKFLEDVVEILDRAVGGEKARLEEMKVLIAFFNLMTKNALAKLSTPRHGCF